MKKRAMLAGGLWGGLMSLALIGLAYLGQQAARLPFVPYDVFDWLTRVLPGAVINPSLELMVRVITAFRVGPTWLVAKRAEQMLSLVILVGAGVVIGALLGWLGRVRPRMFPGLGAAAGLVLLGPALAAEASVGFPPAGPFLSVLWLAVLFLAWGTVLGRLVQLVGRPAPSEPNLDRRRFLWLVGLGSFTVVVSALGVKLFARKSPSLESEAGQVPEPLLSQLELTSGPAASPPLKDLRARIEPAAGTRPEITTNADFYRIDINTRPPQVDGSTWRLEVNGLVDRPLKLSLAEIASRPAVRQAVTLSCISNPVGGDLIGTTIWTGTRLKDVLAEAGLKPGAKAVAVTSSDGYYESIPLAECQDDRTLLVYAMNGEPLSAPHGFPLRVYIPGHFGMKQPKWITRLEAVSRERDGYWVDRGWDRAAAVKTTSVVDAADVKGARGGVVPVGGIAYSGDRGISRVEVQVDGGPWQAAELRTPAISPLAWVEWRFDWRAARGRHTLRVRAYDGRGVLQETDEKDPYPAGATGIHSRKVQV